MHDWIGVCVPEAVAGPTPLSLHSSVIAAWTSGNKPNALLVELWTASSLFEPMSCCKRGLNFPFWEGAAIIIIIIIIKESNAFVHNSHICVWTDVIRVIVTACNQWATVFLSNYAGHESISIVLTVSFHSMILTSSACVRECWDRAEIAAGSSSWNLGKTDNVTKISCNCIILWCKYNNEQKIHCRCVFLRTQVYFCGCFSSESAFKVSNCMLDSNYD